MVSNTLEVICITIDGRRARTTLICPSLRVFHERELSGQPPLYNFYVMLEVIFQKKNGIYIKIYICKQIFFKIQTRLKKQKKGRMYTEIENLI